MRFRLAGGWALVGWLLTAAPAAAGFIRHDVPAAEYNALARQPQFAAAGYLYHDSMGFWHSGVLVAPDVVLTAAHAFDPEFQGRVTREVAGVVFGTSANPFEGETYAVRSVILHPAWPNPAPQHDLALLTLERPVEGIPPARLWAVNPLGKVGVSVGYGLQGDGYGNDLEGADWRLAFEATIDYVGPEDGRLLEALGLPPEEAAGIGVTIRSDFDRPDGGTSTYGSPWPRRLEGGTAEGDSGGALFVPSDTGEWFVAGILFGGFNLYAEDPDHSRYNYGDVSMWAPIFHPANQEFLRSHGIPVVPEPGTWVLGLLAGAIGAGVRWRRLAGPRPAV